MRINEIERLSKSGFEGGKEHLEREYDTGKTIKKLPGGSGLLYSIQPDGVDFKIRLWDPANKGEFEPVKSMHTTKPSYYSNREWKELLAHYEKRNAEMQAKFARSPGKLIGELQVSKPYNFPLKGALKVDIITVDEDYRGIGLAKALYGIVLTIMKRPLLAGSSQTPGGRRNWVSLSQIPGVEMKGYFGIEEYDLKTVDASKADNWDKSYIQSRNKQAEKTIDTIMGQLGGQYIGKAGDEVFFAFDVKPTTTGKELEAAVKQKLAQVYDSSTSVISGLYAVWTGRQ